MIKKTLKFFLPIILIAVLIQNISNDWSEVMIYLAKVNKVYLIVSFSIMLLIYPEGGYAWQRLLKKLGFNTDIKKTVSIWIVASTSRYIPGTIWQYLGRIELSKRNLKLKRQVVIISLLAEVFFVISAALITTFLAFAATGFEVKEINQWLLLLPAAIIFVHPTVMGKLMPLVAKISKKEIETPKVNLSFQSSIKLLPWYVLNFVINATALYFLILAFGRSPGAVIFIEYIGIFSLAWLIGFITVIAPGGVGVTDLTLAYLLSQTGISIAVASTITLTFRILLTVSELVVFLIFLKYVRKD